MKASHIFYTILFCLTAHDVSYAYDALSTKGKKFLIFFQKIASKLSTLKATDKEFQRIAEDLFKVSCLKGVGFRQNAGELCRDGRVRRIAEAFCFNTTINPEGKKSTISGKSKEKIDCWKKDAEIPLLKNKVDGGTKSICSTTDAKEKNYHGDYCNYQSSSYDISDFLNSSKELLEKLGDNLQSTEEDRKYNEQEKYRGTKQLI